VDWAHFHHDLSFHVDLVPNGDFVLGLRIVAHVFRLALCNQFYSNWLVYDSNKERLGKLDSFMLRLSVCFCFQKIC